MIAYWEDQCKDRQVLPLPMLSISNKEWRQVQCTTLHLKLSNDCVKMYYDTSRVTTLIYNVGDPVRLYNPKGVSPKLSRDWKEPYTVVKQINDLVYDI